MVFSSVRSRMKNPLAGITPFNAMVGAPSTATKVQPVRSRFCDEGLYSSIHSSKELASVPIQAISLMIIVPGEKMNTVLVVVGVTVFVKDGEAVGDGELVDVAVFDGEAVGVGEGVALGDGDAVVVCVDDTTIVVELADFGVPLIGLPSASWPLRVIPLFESQLESFSPIDTRSRVAYRGVPLLEVPPGQSPPSRLTESMSFPSESLNKRLSPLFPKGPV